MKKIIIFLIVVILFGAFLGIRSLRPVDPVSQEKIAFLVTRGQSLSEIGQNLKEKNLIRSALAFSLYARFKDLDTKIRAGRFRLSPGMPLSEIVHTLSDPSVAEIAVTFPEGFTIDEMDAKLKELGVTQRGDFKNCAIACNLKILEEDFKFLPVDATLEGYLYPDTYFVFMNNFSEEELLTRMLQNFLKKFRPEWNEAIASQGKTIHDVIIIASIIEKEVKTEKDFPVIAGILWKRLTSGWPLGADATLLYGKEDKIIDPEELDEDSPYNTRKFVGLPPTPIGNPSVKTIEAAIYSQESPYWFYLTTKEGNVIYSKTNEEHNENKRKYL